MEGGVIPLPGINASLKPGEPGWSDKELALRLAAGDEEALGELYDLYSAAAFGLALRVLDDPGRAEDVVQDAFLRIWTAAPTFDHRRGTLRSWLLTIVHHRSVDLLRGREGRARHHLELPPALASESPDGDPWLYTSAALDRTVVLQALDDLPPEQRQVVELIYWGGYSQREVAEMIRIPIGTVKGRVRLGLEKLSSFLSARGLGE